MIKQAPTNSAQRYRRSASSPENAEIAAKARILENTTEVRIRDPNLARRWVKERQQRGIDQPDEVWDGVYIVPPLANNPHQDLVGAFTAILHEVIGVPGRGRVLPGANVSDRRDDWEHNFRAPDVVVVLKTGRAVDCQTHWLGGPDFLIEIQSPRDDTQEKIPFYSQLFVKELLIVHRDTRRLQLYRHDGQSLVLVGQSNEESNAWVQSEVVPLLFRWKGTRKNPGTQVKRADGKPKLDGVRRVFAYHLADLGKG